MPAHGAEKKCRNVGHITSDAPLIAADNEQRPARGEKARSSERGKGGVRKNECARPRSIHRKHACIDGEFDVVPVPHPTSRTVFPLTPSLPEICDEMTCAAGQSTTPKGSVCRQSITNKVNDRCWRFLHMWTGTERRQRGDEGKGVRQKGKSE